MQPQYNPQYPQAPQQQYPPQYPVQPGYAPQYPVQPSAYPAQAYPAVPPQYAPPMPPQQPTVQGSLDDFFNQPGGGVGASWKFKDKPMGTTYSGIVARPIGAADVRQQTDPQNRPLTFKDGRPKFVMIVPMVFQPTAEHPEGQAGWYVKGQARDELVRAMAEAGAPEGPPEAGAAISVTLVGQRPIPGMNPAYQYRVSYIRPAGSVPSPTGAGVAHAPQPQLPPADPQYAPAPVAQPAYSSSPNHPISVPAQPQGWAPQPQPQPSYTPGMAGNSVPTVYIGPNVTPPMASQTVPAQAPAPTLAAGLSPEQQALLAQLTGQQG